MAGTVVVTSQRAEGIIRWARILATADAGDAEFPAVALRDLVDSSGRPAGVHIDGTIIGVITNPGSTAPTDNYDLTLVDQDGLDRLGGVGANRDTANSEWAAVGRAAAPDETLTLTLANNAVNEAEVEVVLYWTPSSSAGGAAATGGAGDASLAEQEAQTALLTTIDADTATIATDASTLASATVAQDTAMGSTDRGFRLQLKRVDTPSTVTPAAGDAVLAACDEYGRLHVTPAPLAASTDSVSLGTVAGQGYTPQQFIDVDESEDEVKGSAGTLHSIIATNVSAGARYLKVYDGTAAGVSVGSTTPKWTIAIPAGAGFVWESAIGIACATGITIAATTGVAVADTGAPGANDVVVSVGYK